MTDFWNDSTEAILKLHRAGPCISVSDAPRAVGHRMIERAAAGEQVGLDGLRALVEFGRTGSEVSARRARAAADVIRLEMSQTAGEKDALSQQTNRIAAIRRAIDACHRFTDCVARFHAKRAEVEKCREMQRTAAWTGGR